MEGIAVLTFLGCIVLAFVVYFLSQRLSALNRRLEWHRRHVHELAERLEQLETSPPAAPAPSPEPWDVIFEAPPPAAVQPAAPAPMPPPEPAAPIPPPVAVPPAPPPPVRGPVVPPHVCVPRSMRASVEAAEAERTARLTPEPAPVAPPPRVPPAAVPSKPRADLEMTIGAGWLSRIGMVAVLLAFAFLVVWLFREGYITPEIITGGGVLLGIGLMVVAELANRRGYGTQSQALTGGGVALLYLTLWAGLHQYGLLGTSLTFVAMVLVTAAGAVQALRHDAQTIAILAWVAGYLVPFFVSDGGGVGAVGPETLSDTCALFAYLVLLSAAVFGVAQRKAWPTFTGLALVGAHGGAGYLFRVSGGSLAWTLTYLLLITGGMLWVAGRRRDDGGAHFGAIGAIAGYAITGTAMLAHGRGELYAPYLYLTLLTGALLVLGRVHGWPALQWCGVLGGFAGFLLLRHAEAAPLGPWLLLYVALTSAGALVCTDSHRDGAESLAVASVLGAYGGAALLAWAPSAGRVPQEWLLAYLTALAAAVLLLGTRRAWTAFLRLGAVAAFVATGLLYAGHPGGASLAYPLAYLVLLSVGTVAAAARSDDRWLAGIGITGAFAALPLTGALGWKDPVTLAPTYLVVAALAASIDIGWRRWAGLEWIALVGAWGLYAVWRSVAEQFAPQPGQLAFSGAFLVILLGAAWYRHGVRLEAATADNSSFAIVSAALFWGSGLYDTGRLPAEWHAAGQLTLALAALYGLAGLVAAWRSPADVCFGPVLIGAGLVFLTAAAPMLVTGAWVTLAWSLEAGVLLALGFAYPRPALRGAALGVLALALGRTLVLDSVVHRSDYILLLNARVLGAASVMAVAYIGALLYSRLRQRVGLGESPLPTALTAVATALLWWIVSAEAWCYTGWTCGRSLAEQHYALSGAWVLFAAVLVQIGVWRSVWALQWSAVALLGATLVKIVACDPPLTSAAYVLLANSHALPMLAAAALLAELAWWHHRRGEAPAVLLGVLAGLLVFWVACSETWLYLGWVSQSGLSTQQFGLSLVWLIFGIGFIALGLMRGQAAFRWLGLLLFTATAGKVLLVEAPLTRETYLPLANSYAFPLMVIAGVCYGLTVWYARVRDDLTEVEGAFAQALPVLASLLLGWALTVEAWRFTGWVLGAGATAQQYALSAVWTAYAAALVTVGLLRGCAPYRWTAMTLFALTIVKVFIFDLASLSLPYRILAFLGLGAVLIVVSFGYQRLVKAQAKET